MSGGVTLWRVSNYATLDGVGGTYVAGRWHTKGHPIVYCSEDPSTALLETLVHIEIDAEDRPQIFQVLKIQSSAFPYGRAGECEEVEFRLAHQFGFDKVDR